jgi:hypothetical protein
LRARNEKIWDCTVGPVLECPSSSPLFFTPDVLSALQAAFSSSGVASSAAFDLFQARTLRATSAAPAERNSRSVLSSAITKMIAIVLHRGDHGFHRFPRRISLARAMLGALVVSSAAFFV